MEQTIRQPHQSLGFKILSLCINGLFLLHLIIYIPFVFFFLLKKEPPVFYYNLLDIIFTKYYLVFFLTSDLGLFMLLRYMERQKILQRTDYWLARLLVSKITGYKVFCYSSTDHPYYGYAMLIPGPIN